MLQERSLLELQQVDADFDNLLSVDKNIFPTKNGEKDDDDLILSPKMMFMWIADLAVY